MKNSRALIFLIFVFFFNLSTSAVLGQCFISKVSNSIGQFFKTTGDSRLDLAMNQEARLISITFGITPNIIIFDDGGSPNAYASSDGSVCFGINLLKTQLWNINEGPIAVAGIMAHEFGHELQYKNSCTLLGMYRELDADYLAGYYLGVKSRILPGNVEGFANSLFNLGDFAFWSPTHHGTPKDRVKAFVEGFDERYSLLFDAYDHGVSFVQNATWEETDQKDSDVENYNDGTLTTPSDSNANSNSSEIKGVLFPSGTVTTPCGCYGPAFPGQQFPNPRCASGIQVAEPCPNGCYGGGAAWCTVCQ